MTARKACTSERCTCGALLPERSANSPADRLCQDCWWSEQNQLLTVGGADPLAVWAAGYRR